MLLDLIYGGIGTGKTQRCIELIEKILKKNPGHRTVVTVPEQYSYITEKRIVEHFGGMGINGIEVLTFSQFFRRYLKNETDYLLPSGKQMLICKAAQKVCDADSIFSLSINKPGFVGKLSELMSEMKHYLITEEALRTASDSESGLMSRKLKAAADIYDEYNALILRGFSDSEDDFEKFADFIEKSNEFENTHILFDGFTDFLPQHYAVIRAFLVKAASVHVTVCKKENSEIYALPAQTAEKLKKMCREQGVKIYEQNCGEECRTVNSPELLHLERFWTDKRHIYADKTKDISLFCAKDLYSETEHAANIILNEVKNGTNYGDIGIMCGDTEKYVHLIEAVFGTHNIPYFIDNDTPVTAHPIILTVLGIFDIIEENWSYESVFRYLRAGFLYNEDGTEYDRRKFDRLENYVLRHGIRGKSRWFSEWTQEAAGVFDTVMGEYTRTEENLEEINATRAAVCKPFTKFYEKGKGTVRELSEALFEFLQDINLFEGIRAEALKLNGIGERDAAERMKKIWNLLMEVINQAVVTMGGDMTSRKNYARILREGLSAAKMKIIPPGLDTVSIGAADKNSSARPKVMIFMGAVSGTMPTEVHSKSIFTDRDREALAKKGIETAGTSQAKTMQEEFKFYRAVVSASERIYFSYPTSNADGEAQLPSAFVKKLYKVFPKLSISDDLAEQKPKEISNSKDAFLYIMRAVSDNSMRHNARLLTRFFKNDEYLSEKLPLVRTAAEYRKKQPQLTAESVRLLYNDYHRYSVSRLNDYAACPFAYYIKHGLKAKEQQTWQIQKFDIGSLLHWAVCEYCSEVDGGADSFEETKQRWSELTDEKSNEIIDRLIDDIAERTLRGLKRDREKISYLIGRMKKILIRSVDIIRLSLTKGDYSAVCYEEKFGVDISWKGKSIGIDGKIDRIDAAPNTEYGELSLRIIDYKSGSKKFDITAISNGEDMQLAVYAIAATELYKKGALGHASKGLLPVTRGLLYNKLNSSTVLCGEDDDAENKIRNSMKLDGVVIVNENDEVFTAAQMDRDIAAGGTSSFLKLAVNSSGNALNKSTSSFITESKFKILSDFVRKTAVSLDEEIYSGKIDILPVGAKRRACGYCKYKEICLYDAGLCKTRQTVANADEAWDYMEKEVGEHAAEKLDR